MIDLTKIKTYPLSQRKNKVSLKDFVAPTNDPVLMTKIWTLFPNILTGRDIREVVETICKCHRDGKQFILMMGAHAIKCGLSPLIIQMLDKKIVTHLAVNGAVAIHDFEIAYIGQTSEDVAVALEDGSFGMARETGLYLNQAYIDGAKKDMGMGESVSAVIEELALPFKKYSIFYRAKQAGVPITVHTSIGTDIIHQHPNCSGEAIGKISYKDFTIFADTLSKLEGGIIFNLGCAVILPEVFLKALTIVRNLGYGVRNFTAVNLDMIDHYRPRVNVLNRPTGGGGHKFFLQGPMEILLPILVYGIFGRMGYDFNA